LAEPLDKHIAVLSAFGWQKLLEAVIKQEGKKGDYWAGGWGGGGAMACSASKNLKIGGKDLEEKQTFETLGLTQYFSKGGAEFDGLKTPRKVFPAQIALQ